MMDGQFVFLGTGSAMGIPVVACKCSVCSSSSPFNKRLRSSGLVLVENKKFIIDAGPDFREQALRYGIDHLDGMFLTHLHEDHISGLDDVRNLYYAYHKSIPCLLSKQTKKEVCRRFNYLFKGIYAAPIFNFQVTKKTCETTIFEGVNVSYITYHQANVPVLGFRIGDFAYVTDIGTYTEKVFPLLQGVDTLVLSLVRQKATALHLGLEEATQFAEKIKAKKIYFTHLSHEIDHEKLSLPKNFFLAYDGLKIPFHLED